MNTLYSPPLLLGVLLYSLLTPINGYSATDTFSQADAQAAVNAAQELYEQSQALGFAWRAAKENLQLAQTALSSGDYNQAYSAAKEASALAEASITQAEKEASAWQNRMPFNTGS